MTRETVEFSNSNGQALTGILEHPSGAGRGWAVLAHCFTCSKSTLASARIAAGLAARGIGTLRFDFTGLGESEGEFAETGFSSNVADLVTAATWMASQERPVGLLVGHSLGGAAAIEAAIELDGVRAVATIGAPSDADHVVQQFAQHVEEIESDGDAEVDIGGRPFRITRAFLDDLSGAQVREAAGRLRRPLLILHSPVDEVVGLENATGLFTAAKHPKSFVSLDRADHMLTDRGDADFAADMISAWAARYIASEDEAAEAPTPEAGVRVRETGVQSPYQNEVLIDGARFLADEPESVGGAGSGPDPYQWVSAGLGACTSITLRMYARRKSWPLDRVTVELTHSRRHHEDCRTCGPDDKIDVFERVISLEGDLDDDQRSRLLEIADRCPVHRTLQHEAVVETRLVTQLA